MCTKKIIGKAKTKGKRLWKLLWFSFEVLFYDAVAVAQSRRSAHLAFCKVAFLQSCQSPYCWFRWFAVLYLILLYRSLFCWPLCFAVCSSVCRSASPFSFLFTRRSLPCWPFRSPICRSALPFCFTIFCSVNSSFSSMFCSVGHFAVQFAVWCSVRRCVSPFSVQCAVL